MSGFDASRRLTGPNRWFAGPAVTLTPAGAAAHDPAALARWADRVRALCAALGWPDPQPRAAAGQLVFAAPADALFTATEVNEWAWAHGSDGVAAAADRFRARAAAEMLPALVALRAAAAGRRLPFFDDDDAVSIGAGSGSRCWPRSVLPAVDAVPWAALHDVPTALVTGSNGKTTTVRLLAAMAAAAGLVPGSCSTEGVVVGSDRVLDGDYAGPAGARAVLRDPRVQAALLETARGGILRRGLAVRHADVGVVTNVCADHLGEYGVVSADDMADTKLALAHVADTLVRNADDAPTMAAALRLPHVARARTALVARDHGHPVLAALRAGGGSTCGGQGGRLLLTHAGVTHDLGSIAAMPLTVGGAAAHNVANIGAAALAAAVLGWSADAIAGVLRRFGERPSDNPGRLERWSYGDAMVLIDYAHNPDGLAQLLAVARALRPAHLLLLLGQAGDRDDAAIADLARTAAAAAPDRVVVKELPQMLRGRQPGAVPALIASTLRAAGVAADRIATEPDEEAAAVALLAAAGPGDVVVLPIHTGDVRDRLRQRLGARSPSR